jgi:MFS family permease
LLSVHLGQLAERHDCRRVIQTGQSFFMLTSVGWGLLFLTGHLQAWHAVILLILHGLAGAVQGPASQLIIHDIVGPRDLASAIRLNATQRQLVVLFGPFIGGLLLFALGPGFGMLANLGFYLPLSIWLTRFKYTGHGRDTAPRTGRGEFRWSESLHVLRDAGQNPAILAMIALAGASSVLVGNAFQAQMPEFAADLGADRAGIGYTLLVGANAAGAFTGGVLLELGGLLRPNARVAIVAALVWCVVIVGFAMAQSYPLAVGLLFVAGIFNLTFLAMAQTLVQQLAPAEQRGRFVGLFNMFALGLRVGSGVTVGVLGSVIGIHWSLGLSAAVLFVVALGLLARTPASHAQARLA